MLPGHFSAPYLKGNIVPLHCTCMKRLDGKADLGAQQFWESGDVGKRKFPGNRAYWLGTGRSALVHTSLRYTS